MAALEFEVSLGTSGRALFFHLLDGELAFGAHLELRLVEVFEVFLTFAGGDALCLPQFVEGDLALARGKGLVLDEALKLARALGCGVTVNVHLAVDVIIALGGELSVITEHALLLEVALVLEDRPVDLVLISVVVAHLLARRILIVKELHLLLGHGVDLTRTLALSVVVLLGAALSLLAFAEGIKPTDHRWDQLCSL